MANSRYKINKELNFNKQVFDNIYGFIYLTEDEKRLLGHPFFQRLQNIKQLALAHFVFPGAVHTRYSHSLGVLYIVEKFFQRIIKYKGIKREVHKKHKIIRLAALLHDIGHYPLSHTIESSYRESYYIKSSLDNKINTDIYPELKGVLSEVAKEEINNIVYAAKKSNLGTFLKYYDKDTEHHHENLARTVIKSPKFSNYLCKSFDLEAEDLNIICDIIQGINTREDYFILSKLIKSNFDADQIDYMLRDTKNTGINSSIDIDFIIDNALICKKLYKIPNKIRATDFTKDTLCFDIKALQAIEQFLLSKYYWYTSILYYDKVYIMNFIAQRLFSYLLLEKKVNTFKNKNHIENILINTPDDFFFFNDNFFWDQIKNILSAKSHPKIVKELAESIIHKKIPKALDENFFFENFNGNSVITGYSNLFGYKENLDTEIINFNKLAIQKSPYHLPVHIDKEIFKSGYKLLDNNCSKLSYLEDESINISISDNNCINIIEIKDQLLNEFIFNKELKAKIADLKKKISGIEKRINILIIKINRYSDRLSGESESVKSYIETLAKLNRIKRILYNRLDEFENSKKDPASDCKCLHIFRVYDFKNIIKIAKSRSLVES